MGVNEENKENEEGGVTEIEGLRRRVAELSQREAALAERLELCSQIEDALPDLVALKGEDLRIRHANKAFCEFHGKTLEQIVGATEAELQPSEVAEAHALQDGRVLASGIVVIIASEVLARHDGGRAHFHTIRRAMRDVAGNITGVLVSSRPIQADQHVTAAGASASAEHNQLLLSIIPDLYFRIARDGTFIDFSAPKGSDTALPPALFLGKKIADIMPDLADQVMACAEEALGTGELRRFEYSIFKKGVFFDYEARIIVSGPDEVLALVRDITDQKRLQEEERRLREEIIRVQEMMVAELSTPLIPLSSRVVVMPIIGTLDDARASRILERLLHGVVERQAAVAILDITGMSSVTTHTAGMLVRCAQAVRLLGAKVMLTGIRPDVAQTLVEMGVDLSGISTLGTLQAGIERAARI